MKVNLNKFQLVYYIGGSVVYSAHEKEDIWRRVAEEFIIDLRDEEMDFLWWVCYRDFWNNYFDTSRQEASWGAKSYIQGLAALNRNNMFLIQHDDGVTVEECMCYKFQGRYFVLCDKDNRYIDTNHTKIVEITHVEVTNDNKIPDKFLSAWKDLEMYNKPMEELAKISKQ